MEQSKDKRIKTEKSRLNKIFKDIDENKLKIAKALIDRYAFIKISLEDLEEDLNRYGWIEEYQNGANQRGLKKSASAEVHISLTKNLNMIVKQLLEIVPAEKKKNKLDELMNNE